MVFVLWALGAFISCVDVVHGVATASPDHASITVPLRRRAPVSGYPSFDTLAAMADNLRQKYNYPSHSLRRRQHSSAVPITNLNADSSYSGQLTIGTPGQTFGVILDTGSSDLWVASTSCVQGCKDAREYNPNTSKSFKNLSQEVSITYGSGTVIGTASSDSVTMGGFQVSQTFLAATRVSSGLLDADLSGLLGLGFKSIATTGATPFVQALVGANSLSSPLMTFYLTRFNNDQNAQNVEPGGVFTLGATNSSLFQGDIDYVNIPSTVTPGFWLLPVTGITVGGKPLSNSASGPQLAAIDTGTTLIGGPSDAVSALYAQIPGSKQGSGDIQGYYTYPCNSKVNVAFSFGGKNSWPMSPADFQLRAQSSDGSVVCVGAVFDLTAAGGGPGSGGPPQKRQASTPDNPQWIIGDSFLKNVYSVFRYEPPSVGFAQLASSLPNAGPSPGPATGGLSPPGSGSGAQSVSVNLLSIFTLVGTTLLVLSNSW